MRLVRLKQVGPEMEFRAGLLSDKNESRALRGVYLESLASCFSLLRLALQDGLLLCLEGL